jgi:VIT1/CCC1 family predicted Fe2+/Mn2+ transporter
MLSGRAQEIWTCGAAVILALGLTGSVSAWLGRTSFISAIARTIIGGLLGMAITYGVGHLAGTRV